MEIGTLEISDFSSLLDSAIKRRRQLFENLHAEQTDCYRLFNGVSDGLMGLTIDRYGPLVLIQTFREPLPSGESSGLPASFENALRRALPFSFFCVYNHRGKTAKQSFELWHRPSAEALVETECHESGLTYLIRARHSGIDPWLFLDLRAGRRRLFDCVQGCSVLNLFSYTCSAGIRAAARGASQVWNVDFSASVLEVGNRNAQRNRIPSDRFRIIQEDCLPVMRQLADLPTIGRRNRTRRLPAFEPRHFDLVFLDPPAWSKGSFGAIDVKGDYSSLFKPAVLIAKPSGGRILATNHVASVDFDSWIEVLRRCAAKAGRPIRSLQKISPDADFHSFDHKPPLKIVICEV